MTSLNNTDEYNGIETGNTVFVSGLIGKNYSFINNRYGIVKDIYLTSDNNKISYIAEIEFHGDKDPYFVNFDYIYKIGKKLNNQALNDIIFYHNPYDYYIEKKRIIETHPLTDENGQIVGVGIDSNYRTHFFLYSGIN